MFIAACKKFMCAPRRGGDKNLYLHLLYIGSYTNKKTPNKYMKNVNDRNKYVLRMKENVTRKWKKERRAATKSCRRWNGIIENCGVRELDKKGRNMRQGKLHVQMK